MSSDEYLSDSASAKEDLNGSDYEDHIISDDERIAKKKKRTKKGKTADKSKAKNDGYAWEAQIHRSWDIVLEDADGSLKNTVQGLVEASKRKRITRNTTPFQRGIIRSMILIVDNSVAMAEKDFRPSRASLTTQSVVEFVDMFFEENPISQLGVVGMRSGVASVVSPSGADPAEHKARIRRYWATMPPEGEPSLQNALEMARGMLMHASRHSTKEVVVVFGTLFTADPGDIFKTVAQLVKEGIRVRIVGLSAEVQICRKIVAETNFGEVSHNYGVALNEQHFKELLNDCITPLAIKGDLHHKFSLIRMGFPQRIAESVPSFCSCHSCLNYGGYICPMCKAKVCSIPAVCSTCNLMLISSTHLARSYHHLFPLENYEEVKFEECVVGGGAVNEPFIAQFGSDKCFGCMMEFPVKSGAIDPNVVKSSSRFRCGNCKNEFCIDCNVFIHEELHNCPGC